MLKMKNGIFLAFISLGFMAIALSTTKLGMIETYSIITICFVVAIIGILSETKLFELTREIREDSFD